MTEDRKQSTENRKQRSEDRKQRSEDRGQRSEDRGQMNIGSRAGLRARRHWPAQSPALLLTSERRTFEPRTPESRTISSGTS